MKKSTSVITASALLIMAICSGCQYVGADSVTAPANQTAATTGHQQLSDGVIAQVRGLRVVVGGADSDSMKMRPFNWNPGTTIAVSIQRPQGGIIGFDRDATKVAVFRDNHGTDLWNGAQASKFSTSSLDMMPQVADDGTEILFEVDAQGVPRRGSTTFTLRGELLLWVGSEKESLTAKNVELKSGSKFQVGERSIEVTQTGAPTWDDDNAFAATLKLKGDVADIIDIAFTDASDRELPSRRQSSLWSGSGDTKVNQWEYVFETEPSGPVQVIMTRWTDLNPLTLPLDLTFGAGL